MKHWLSLSLALFYPALAMAVDGTLTPVKGTVYIQKADANLWQEISGPLIVQEGDRIKTGMNSKAFVITPDDHRVALGPNTQLTFQRMAEGETKFFLKNGSIRNKVRKLQTEMGQYYKVQTPSAVVAVRGTDFAVLQENIARVQVYEGLVDLSALNKEVGQAITQLSAGHSAEVEMSGAIQEQKPTPSTSEPTATPQEKKQGDEQQGPPQGPPPGGPPQGSAPPPPSGWWESPAQMDKEPNLFKPPEAMRPMPGEGQGPRPPAPLSGPKPPMPGVGDPPMNTVLPPPIPPGGNSTGSTPPLLVGLDALIDTMRSRNLHEQANAILVADLFQRNAVRTDPLSGQLRQYADAVYRDGTDGIRFVNATMLPGIPDTLHFTETRTKFNTTLPTAYWNATRTAFAADSTFPSYYAVEHHTHISNTVDHLNVDAYGGFPTIGSDLLYETTFNDISTKINGTTLWSKTGTTYFYRGGAAPTTTKTATGRADIEVRDQYNDGTFLTVRHTFSNDQGQIPSLANLPSTMSADNFLNTLNIRTTIRSNLLQKGSLDIFGSVQGRTLSGFYSFDQFDAKDILQGLHEPFGAPIGMTKS